MPLFDFHLRVYFVLIFACCVLFAVFVVRCIMFVVACCLFSLIVVCSASFVFLLAFRVSCAARCPL